MLSKSLNLITLPLSKLTFFIWNSNFMLLGNLKSNYLYCAMIKNTLCAGPLTLDGAILKIKWYVRCARLTALSLSVLVHCWCCFQPIMLCLQHMSLTCQEISDSICNQRTYEDNADILPSPTAPCCVRNSTTWKNIRKSRTLGCLKSYSQIFLLLTSLSH